MVRPNSVYADRRQIPAERQVDLSAKNQLHRRTYEDTQGRPWFLTLSWDPHAGQRARCRSSGIRRKEHYA